MSAHGQGGQPERRCDGYDAILWRRFRGVAGDEVKANPVHRLKLAGASPAGFSLHLRNISPPDVQRGEALMGDV